MNSFILYEGKSQLDGKPIVVIATGLNGSANKKTGSLVQTWIIRSDIAPHEAIKTGDDSSICGDCTHRGKIVDGKLEGRSCYVLTHQAPLSVYKSFLKGKYTKPSEKEIRMLLKGKKLRLGAYGDPLAVPFEVWENALSYTIGNTGYTHQWQEGDSRFNKILMASCDSLKDQINASKAGYRTFRVKTKLESLVLGEIACPASKEQGQKTSCEKCLLCGGMSKLAKNIAIIAHGVGSTNFERKVA